MPIREWYAGVSITSGVATTAIIERRNDETELLHLDLCERSPDSGALWFLAGLSVAQTLRKIKIKQINVGLDNALTSLIRFPIDSSLGQSEINDQLRWELSHYIDDYQPNHYVSDLHTLDTLPGAASRDVLAVTVERSQIFELHSALADRGLTLGVVDINHFAADTAILHTHPEVAKTSILSVSVSDSRIDLSILRNGSAVGHSFAAFNKWTEASKFIASNAVAARIPLIYFQGTGMTREFVSAIDIPHPNRKILLNPFRRLLISPAIPHFDRHMNHAHRFASCVGIALRRN